MISRIYKLYRVFLTKYYTLIIKRKAKAYGKGLKVNYKSNISKNTFLGSNVNFNGMSMAAGSAKITIGNNFHSGHNCQIIARYHNYDHGIAIPYDHTFIEKDVTIEDNVWLGANVIILGGVTIGEGAIIQAGSVVVKSIPKYGIAGGNPAKVFKYRNIEHYTELKNKQKFY